MAKIVLWSVGDRNQITVCCTMSKRQNMKKVGVDCFFQSDYERLGREDKRERERQKMYQYKELVF